MASSDYTVVGVPRESLPLVWPSVEPMLSAALERDGQGADTGEVFDRIDAGSCMLWTVLDGTDIVAVLVIHLRGPHLVVWLMGGRDFADWHEVVEPLLVRYAGENGASSVRAQARPGIGRALKRWRKRSELIELRA